MNINRPAALFSTLLLLAVWFRAVRDFPGLPPRIPIHFNILGRFDGWGPRWMIFFLPAISSLLLFFFAVILRFVPIRAEGNSLPFLVMPVIFAGMLFINRKIALIAVSSGKGGSGISILFLPIFLMALAIAHFVGIWLPSASRRH